MLLETYLIFLAPTGFTIKFWEPCGAMRAAIKGSGAFERSSDGFETLWDCQPAFIMSWACWPSGEHTCVHFDSLCCNLAILLRTVE